MTLQKKIETTIRSKIKKTMDCDYKRDWIPRGYFCGKVKKFIKELTEDLVEKLK